MKSVQLTTPQWAGVVRIDYQSSVDGIKDWALLRPPEKNDTWIVNIHGHGSHGDQLYTRPDIRDTWLPTFKQNDFGIVSPNLRDNAWMAPQAAADLPELLEYVRKNYQANRFIFASGSMGGTSNLIYAALHPEDVAAVVALGAATDLSAYANWCRTDNTGIRKEIADTIESAYGGSSEKIPAVYNKHSALENSSRLTMPIFLAHGGSDQIIDVEQSRRLAKKLSPVNSAFIYREIPGGDHDSPLTFMAEGIAWASKHLKP
jgi:pimeloyl-ACP methyl ester carboxylesterase